MPLQHTQCTAAEGVEQQDPSICTAGGNHLEQAVPRTAVDRLGVPCSARLFVHRQGESYSQLALALPPAVSAAAQVEAARFQHNSMTCTGWLSQV